MFKNNIPLKSIFHRSSVVEEVTSKQEVIEDDGTEFKEFYSSDVKVEEPAQEPIPEPEPEPEEPKGPYFK